MTRSNTKEMKNIQLNSTSIPLLKLPGQRNNNFEISQSMLKYKKNDLIVSRNNETLNKLPYFTRKVIPVRNFKKELMRT